MLQTRVFRVLDAHDKFGLDRWAARMPTPSLSRDLVTDSTATNRVFNTKILIESKKKKFNFGELSTGLGIFEDEENQKDRST